MVLKCLYSCLYKSSLHTSLAKPQNWQTLNIVSLSITKSRTVFIHGQYAEIIQVPLDQQILQNINHNTSHKTLTSLTKGKKNCNNNNKYNFVYINHLNKFTKWDIFVSTYKTQVNYSKVSEVVFFGQFYIKWWNKIVRFSQLK